MRFCTSENNGVLAAISEEHARLYVTAKKSGGDPIKAGVRVFTFCERERLERDETARLFFTGTHDDFSALIRNGGHEVTGNSEGWDGYVPFSNHLELRGRELAINLEEAKYACNLHDVLAVFGQDSCAK